MVISATMAFSDKLLHGSNYEKGVYFLARIIQRILALCWFRKRISTQVSRLSGIDNSQAVYSLYAINNSIIILLAKLIDPRGDTWSFSSLKREWIKYIKDRDIQKDVEVALAKLTEKLKPYQDYRHGRGAHQKKNDDPYQLTTFVNEEIIINDAVELMDMFVEGKISYELIFDQDESINLREELLGGKHFA